MKFLKALRKAERSSWANSASWAILQIIFILILPALYTYSSLLTQTGEILLREPYRHGELALLSISLLSGSFFVISKSFATEGLPPRPDDGEGDGRIGRLWDALKNLPFPGFQGLSLWILIWIALSTWLFGFSISHELNINPEATMLNLNFIGLAEYGIVDLRIWGSAVFLFISFVTTLFITVVEDAEGSGTHDVRRLFAAGNSTWRKKYGPNVGDENGE